MKKFFFIILLSIPIIILSQNAYDLKSLIKEAKYFYREYFAFIDPNFYIRNEDYRFFNEYLTHLSSDQICLYIFLINKLESNITNEKNLNLTMKELFKGVIEVKKNIAIENSIIVLISIEDKIMKIERGLVISKEITDKICAKIIKHRLPIFNSGDYLQGVIGVMSDIQYYHDNFDDYQDLDDDIIDDKEKEKEKDKDKDKDKEKKTEDDKSIKNEENNDNKNNNIDGKYYLYFIIIGMILLLIIILIIFTKRRKNYKSRNSEKVNYSLLTKI